MCYCNRVNEIDGAWGKVGERLDIMLSNPKCINQFREILGNSIDAYIEKQADEPGKIIDIWV